MGELYSIKHYQMEVNNICYVLVKKPTNTYYSIKHGSQTKPQIIAFRYRHMATQFASTIKDVDEFFKPRKTKVAPPVFPLERLIHNMITAPPKVQLEVLALKKDQLVRRCALNGLDLTVVSSDYKVEPETYNIDIDDYTFHLENSLKYY
jgi:hypothetical protein